jgi:hypothetical protein
MNKKIKYTLKNTKNKDIILNDHISFNNLRHIQYEPNKLYSLLDARKLMNIIEEKQTSKNIVKPSNFMKIKNDLEKLNEDIRIIKAKQEKCKQHKYNCENNIKKCANMINLLKKI